MSVGVFCLCVPVQLCVCVCVVCVVSVCAQCSCVSVCVCLPYLCMLCLLDVLASDITVTTEPVDAESRWWGVLLM